MWLFYYIGEILQEAWWIPVVMGIITCIVMHFAPKQEEWESLEEFYDGSLPSADQQDKNKENE